MTCLPCQAQALRGLGSPNYPIPEGIRDYGQSQEPTVSATLMWVGILSVAAVGAATLILVASKR